jgi:3-methyladenine DNA glycosylase/8-oxoguanine DNA glycosylase
MPRSSRTTRLRVSSPRFDFVNLVHSHGWRALAPYSWDEAAGVLRRPLRLGDGESVAAEITAKQSGERTAVAVKVGRAPLSAADRAAVRRQVSRILSLSDDLSEFHAVCADDPLLRFVAETRSGRMLRSPTAFEDVIKTVCTTNCDWRNTLKMCERLCEIGGGDFPTPRQVLKYSPARLARRVPLGYRSRTVLEIARRTEEGKLPLDEWAAAGDFERVRGALREVWGVGPYALSHMLVMLGDYSSIPVDCEVLKYLQAAHFGGAEVTAKEAVGPYERYGRHRFLAFKFGRMARKMNFSRFAVERGLRRRS